MEDEKMDIVEFAERVMGLELFECQKEMLRKSQKIPKDSVLVMTSRGPRLLLPKQDKPQ